jgi:hypothetical protein
MAAAGVEPDGKVFKTVNGVEYEVRSAHNFAVVQF